VRPPLHTLKIWGARVNSPWSYGAEFVFLFVCFFCPSLYDARHRKPRRFVYALKLGGTGISPPDTFSLGSSFRFHSSFRFRSRSRSSYSSTISGDIFYCSGSRQLNNSSCCCFEWQFGLWTVVVLLQMKAHKFSKWRWFTYTTFRSCGFVIICRKQSSW